MSKYSNNKYPTINYIGNKDKLSEWILSKFPVNHGIVLDLFCGGCSVSYALKNKGYTVHSNDVLYSNYVLAKYLIENNNKKLNLDAINFDILSDEYKTELKDVEFLVNNLFFDYEIEELAKLIHISKKLKGYDKYIFLSLLRRSMIRKIPYSRMNVEWKEIVKLRNEEYSYKKYGRKRAYHNKTFIYHIKDNLEEYNNAVINNEKENKAFQKDAFKLLKNTNQKYDVIYLDPPYPGTMNKYNEFYGCFDIMFNKNIKATDLTNKEHFLTKFEDIIKICKNKTRYVVISLNDKLDYNEFITMLKKYGKVKLNSKKYQYKITGKENKNTYRELLITLEF